LPQRQIFQEYLAYSG